MKKEQYEKIVSELKEYINSDMSYLSEKSEYARGFKNGVRVVRNIIDGIINNNTKSNE